VTERPSKSSETGGEPAHTGLVHQIATLTRATFASPAGKALVWLMVAAVLVVVATAYGQIRLNSWNKPFYDALARRDLHEFVFQLGMFGVIAGAAFGGQAILKKINRNFRMAAQIAGALGLTATAPAAYYVVTGRIDATGLALWLANWCFAADQIHFVQLRIHAARVNGIQDRLVRGKGFFAGQVILAVALAFAWRFGRMPGIAAFAFVPLLLRGFAWFFSNPEPLAVHKLGKDELTHAIVFGALTIVGFIV